MKYFPRLLGLGLLGLLISLLVMACETTKHTTNEFGSLNPIEGDVILRPESRQIVHFTDSSAEYKTPRSELAQAFIRQFGDGTVVDKILVRKAPIGPQGPVVYYLIGVGLRNGMFRAMALPLTSGGDNTFYLSPTAARYTITSVRCPACFFNFENGRIVGTSCGENSTGSNCDLKIDSNNSLFASSPTPSR
ncbi:hypothetical protein [Hymenobacter terrenus]|uniref:hypothetical protein n=1 Tax=Hymenobacter terrenus TaxID=1629124 RepID=UPI0012E02E5E|nr:hypothetical protein [Hymenobacter terrenus]